MPIKYLVIGSTAGGTIIERWWLRSWYLIDVAKLDMMADQHIKQITVVGLCMACGNVRRNGLCVNTTCITREPALEAAHV